MSENKSFYSPFKGVLSKSLQMKQIFEQPKFMFVLKETIK